ncbi:energy transducer TonB [Hymenobacter sp. GOD-10R]|uniref:energy transducer TonB n=1 Tax=Hymenobacter sp. GOD-10R TaxID=3093922 RepID=UPI002D7697FB|nr:energy transducer TonB [Hymenobacter sp. GOD-10R]WRQ29473.1 energy transducer TonB [Hymenobacter sp. GOD-10R]
MTIFSRLLLTALLTTATLSTQAQQKLAYPKDPKASEIYDTVEKPAVPVGGVEAYGQYLADNQQYPTAALQQDLQGTVNVTFVVEKTGVVSNVTVPQPLAPALDAEAIRLIKGGPKWTPAQHRGEKVRQRVTIPVAFQIPQGSEPSAAGTPSGAGSDQPQTVAPDEPARPVGGTDAFFTWIQENLRYPTLARQRKIEGRVMVEFVVQKDGSLTEPKLVKRLGSGCDEEALRLIKAAPKWNPARYKGQPLRQKMVLPVVFQL